MPDKDKKKQKPAEQESFISDQKAEELIDTASAQDSGWKQKAEEYLSGWQRTQAELVNYRKRSDEEKAAFTKFAHADVLVGILPVLDNFKRAAQHAPATDGEQVKSWVEGIKQIEKQFESVLQNYGISQIEVSVGDQFDPTKHEALMSEDSEHPADTITGVIDPGYMLHEKVLRPAKVKVSK